MLSQTFNTISKRFSLLYILMLLPFAGVNAQKIIDAPSMYVYGVAYSATDSIVYMTEVQPLENAQISKKTKFLYARNELSTQLKQHMYLAGEKNQTCCVTFDQDRIKTEKKYLKQKAYFQKKGFVVKFIHPDYFKFKAVRTSSDSEDLEFVD